MYFRERRRESILPHESLNSLRSLKHVDSLSAEEEFVIYSGFLNKGSYSIYVGYSLFNNIGRPLIHGNAIPLKINVE